MRVPLYTTPTVQWTERLMPTDEYPRHWVTIIDLEIELSDGQVLNIPKGTIWDGASIPKWLWWLMKPIDEGAIADLLHDWLWGEKENQLKYRYALEYEEDAEVFRSRYYWRFILLGPTS